MKKEITNNPNIFGCRTIELIPWIIFFTIASIFFLPWAIAFFKSMAEPWQPGYIWNFLLCGISIIYVIAGILFYIANKKSSIEVSDTHLIIKKPVTYPFFRMETIIIPYNEIKSLNPVFWYNGHFKIIITKKAWDGEDWTIKFFWLSDYLGFLNKLQENFAKDDPEDLKQDWKNETYSEEKYWETLYNYKIYRRKPRWFDRIVLIIFAVITLIFIVTIPLSVIVILIIIWDVRKCKSYIEFTNSHVIINSYQWDIFGKKLHLEIPYYEISEIKCFKYFIHRGSMHNTWCNFNIYFKNSEQMESFTVDIYGDFEDIWLIKQILANKNIKFDIHSKR